MKTKLNAEELAAKRWPKSNTANRIHPDVFNANGYAAAIREVAQPIADQRDELLEALDAILANVGWNRINPTILDQARAAIAKCTTP